MINVRNHLKISNHLKCHKRSSHPLIWTLDVDHKNMNKSNAFHQGFVWGVFNINGGRDQLNVRPFRRQVRGVPFWPIPIPSGWWFQSLWKIWKSVGMIIPNMGQYNMFQTTNQPSKHLTSQDFESESVSAFKEGTICVSVNLWIPFWGSWWFLNVPYTISDLGRV